MIILNTTFVVTRLLCDEFVKWLNEVYVPAALATGIFTTHRIARVLKNEQHEVESLACELCCESLSEAVRWHDQTAVLLRDDMTARWGENAMFFTTYLRTVS